MLYGLPSGSAQRDFGLIRDARYLNKLTLSRIMIMVPPDKRCPSAVSSI